MLKKNSLIIIGSLIILSFLGFYYIYKNTDFPISIQVPSSVPYMKWDMDSISNNEMLDSKGNFTTKLFNVKIVDGYSGKAVYLNGKDSYIETPINFQGWDGITISLWVKPECAGTNELSAILDNGHTAKTDFVIQSADSTGEKWVWYCNGIHIFLLLPLEKWTHVIVSANAKEGAIMAMAGINGKIIGKKYTNPFKFGTAPLTIGKLYNADMRYFKGYIDEVAVWDKAIEDNDNP